MKHVHCLLVYLLSALLFGGPLPAQAGWPDRDAGLRSLKLRVVMLWKKGRPTHTAMADRLLRLLPGAVRPARYRSPLQLEGMERGEVVVVFGNDYAEEALLRSKHDLVIVTTGLEEPLMKDFGARRVLRLHLAPDRAAYGRALKRFLPQVRRVGIVSGAASRLPVFEKNVKVQSLKLLPGKTPEELVTGWSRDIDVLLVPDDRAVTPLAEGLSSCARKQGIPVITDASWLARRDVTLGVLPDLGSWTLRIAHAVKAVHRAADPPVFRATPPSRVLVNLASSAFERRKPSALALAGADLIVVEPGGRRRDTTRR